MNCKPGQLALVVRRSHGISCTRTMQGLPVKVARLHVSTSLVEHLIEALDGPLWLLEAPVRCAQCGHPFGILPDSILRPFDPDSAPEANDEDTSLDAVAGGVAHA